MSGSPIPSDVDDASSWTHHRARVAALSRDREPDDPELQAARQRLKAARLEDHVRKIVEAWPPLDQSQLDAIAILLRPTGGPPLPPATGARDKPLASSGGDAA